MFTDNVLKSILQKSIEIEKWAKLVKSTKPFGKELNFIDILDELRYDGQDSYVKELEKAINEWREVARKPPTVYSSRIAFRLFKKLRRIIENRTDDSKKLLLYADSIEGLIENDRILYSQIWDGEFITVLNITVSHFDGYDLFTELLERIEEKDPAAAKQIKEKYDQLISLSNAGKNTPEKDLESIKSVASNLVSLMREIAQAKPTETDPVEVETEQGIAPPIMGTALTKAPREAYVLYEYATEKNLDLATAKDDDVYDWLKTKKAERDNELADYELPSRDTWKRQLRIARNFHGTQKHKPRAGRVSNAPNAIDDPDLLLQITNRRNKPD